MGSRQKAWEAAGRALAVGYAIENAPPAQPVASSLYSLGGSVAAIGAIVPAGAGGAVSVYVIDPTDVILDINGYFDTSTGTTSYSF